MTIFGGGYNARVNRIKLFFVLLVAIPACADTIYLKNGGKIQADSTKASGQLLKYEVGDDTFSIPLSAVDHVEGPAAILKGGPPKCPTTLAQTVAGHPTAPHSTDRVPLPAELLCKQFGPKSTSVKDWMPACELIMAHGGVEQDVLATTEMKCNAPLSADAYFMAANFDHKGTEDQGALEYLQTSLSYAPEHAESLDMIIDVLENLHRYPEEVQYAQQAARVIGPQMLGKLGRAYYLAGNKGEAMRIWGLYQQVAPYANVQTMQQSAEQKRQENDYNNRRQWPDPQPSADDPE